MSEALECRDIIETESIMAAWIGLAELGHHISGKPCRQAGLGWRGWA
ncbi:hypothetical protein ABZ777_09440 [Micromonospora parva]